MFLQQPTFTEAKVVAEQILRDPAYQRIDEDGGRLTDAFENVGGWLNAWMRWLEDLSDDSPALYWLLFIVLLLILGLLIFHIVWTFRQAFRKRALVEGFPLGTPGLSHESELRQWLQQALEKSAYTDALSFRFRLGLLYMARKNPGRLRPGMTNRECLSAWHDRPELQLRLAEVVDLLDYKWYARQECITEEYEHAEKILQEME